MNTDKRFLKNIEKTVKELLLELPDRAREVLIRRFGLSEKGVQETLETIGKSLGITRERVRQIEKHGITTIRSSSSFLKQKETIETLHAYVDKLGCIISEEDLLCLFSADGETRNRVHFLLELGDIFVRVREDDHFFARWHVDEDVSLEVEEALRALHEELPKVDTVSEEQVLATFRGLLKKVDAAYTNDDTLKRWLSMSRVIDCNALGEWGRVSSPSIRAKGIRDYVYLAMRRHGSPMHFKEVSKSIALLFKKKAHPATCHNELIKDKRFVLVGRGLYALRDWGYKEGVVRDVIAEILKRDGPLTKQEIFERVKRERYVKENTILVNLHQHFKKGKDGKYGV